MFVFLSNNIGTIVVALALLVIVTAVILNIRRDKKRNKCAGCPCGCADSGGEFKKVPFTEKPAQKINSIV
jgi:hypothetical protein